MSSVLGKRDMGDETKLQVCESRATPVKHQLCAGVCRERARGVVPLGGIKGQAHFLCDLSSVDWKLASRPP